MSRASTLRSRCARVTALVVVVPARRCSRCCSCAARLLAAPVLPAATTRSAIADLGGSPPGEPVPGGGGHRGRVELGAECGFLGGGGRADAGDAGDGRGAGAPGAVDAKQYPLERLVETRRSTSSTGPPTCATLWSATTRSRPRSPRTTRACDTPTSGRRRVATYATAIEFPETKTYVLRVVAANGPRTRRSIRTRSSRRAKPLDHESAFDVVSPFEPAGDQPKAIAELTKGIDDGPALPDASRRHRLRQDVHDGQGHRGGAEADARHGAEQDARRAARLRAAGLPARQRGRLLRELLRLLPARSLRSLDRHLHREGLLDQRGGREAAPRGDRGAALAQGRRGRGAA